MLHYTFKKRKDFRDRLDAMVFTIITKDDKLKNKNKMKTDIELLELLRDAYLEKANKYIGSQININFGLCVISYELYMCTFNIDKEEYDRLNNLIWEMRPENNCTEDQRGYFWPPEDTLPRRYAIIDLIKKKKEERGWQVLNEYHSPISRILKGEILTDDQIKVNMRINNPEDYPNWFKKIEPVPVKDLHYYIAIVDNKLRDITIPILFEKEFPKLYFQLLLETIALRLKKTAMKTDVWYLFVKDKDIFLKERDTLLIGQEKSNSMVNYKDLNVVYFEEQEHAQKAIDLIGQEKLIEIYG